MKYFRIVVCSTLFVVFSCSDETTVFNESLEENVILENSASNLSASINYENSGVLEIFEDAANNSKTQKQPLDETLAGDYPLVLIAEVTPPSRAGLEHLTASHVHVVDNYAYVSYNTVDNAYGGAIDIIDVSDPNIPKVSSRLYYSNADINSIQYDNGYIYIVGGVDAEKSVRATSNSFLAKIMVSNGKMNLSGGISYAFQEGYNATDLVVSEDDVLVTSGSQGFIASYNKHSIVANNQAPFDDLRSVALLGEQIAVLDASFGVKILDKDFNVTSEIPINADFGTNAKRTLDFMGRSIIVAEGSRGAGVYDIASGVLKEQISISTQPNLVDAQDLVTNAVATNGDAILMANGGAGLSLSEYANVSDLVGIIQLDASVNYVASKGDYIYAASGTRGLQIIKFNKPTESLVARCADVSTVYTGSNILTVPAGENRAYSGKKRLRGVQVGGELLLCGSWSVFHSVKVDEQGELRLNGTLAVGKNKRRRNITIGKNGVFKVEGNVTIFGSLILEEGATLEFLGDDSVINVFGSVTKHATAEIHGNFLDVKNKF